MFRFIAGLTVLMALLTVACFWGASAINNWYITAGMGMMVDFSALVCVILAVAGSMTFLLTIIFGGMAVRDWQDEFGRRKVRES